MTVIGLTEQKEAVIQAVLAVYGLTRKQVKSRARTSSISQARFVIWHHLRNDLGMTLKEIGTEYDRHHSDIIHGLRRIKQLNKENRLVSDRTRKVRKILKEGTL